MKYSIEDIAKILKIKNVVFNESEINILLTDSRVLRSPKDSLFFALITENNDAHKYVDELYDLSVRNFVVSKMLPQWKNYTDANFLVVKDTLEALQNITARYRKKFAIPVIGITGSNGKTIVKEWLFQILHTQFQITRSPRSFNSQIGVPLSVWEMNDQTTLGIFEAGMSCPEEMGRLEPIIQPTIGIFTNIGQAHQEAFKTVKEKCLEKLDLFINADIIICEEENDLLDECMQIACLSHKRFTWSRRGNDSSPVHILKTSSDQNKTIINFAVLGLKSSIEIPFTDAASIENAIHVLTASIYLRASIKDVREEFTKLEPISMRLDVREGNNNCLVINDSYNSDINSLSIALDFMNQRATNLSLKKVLVLSDIPQTGIPPKDLYSLTSSLIQGKKIDILIGIGSDLKKNQDLFLFCESYFYAKTSDFINSGIFKTFRNSCILLKGARAFAFEELTKILELKSHETILEIDLDAIVHNYNFYRSKLNSSTKIIGMVKADGYGSGSSEIAKTLQYHKADYFAVAVAEEGISLRKAGIKIPIMVLNSEVGGFDELYTNCLEPEIYNFRMLEAFIAEASRKGCSDYPIHLKLDTGMHRLGFTEEEISCLIDALNNQSQLKVCSVFSHLAASENSDFDAFTKQQLAKFQTMCNSIKEGLHYSFMRHILNSAGIERFVDYQFEMVRLGISLYGVSASGLTGLKNIHTLKTTILQIKELQPGDTVGYGCCGKIMRPSKIATIRIGYADGLNRRFGNGVGVVLINGMKAPYVGNICMDLSMVDITDIPEVKEGDIATIFGQELTIQDLANRIGTIPYEILTSISPRVKHLYFKE